MVTYKQLLENTITDEEAWKHDKPGLAKELDISNAESCRQFIRCFLEDLDKGYEFARDLRELESLRLQHIVSVFFFGVAIYKNSRKLHDSIDHSLMEFVPAVKKHHTNPFPLMWMLICLFHDLAYRDEYLHTYRSYDKLLEVLNPTVNWQQRELDSLEGVPELYKNVAKKYFKYISEEFKKSDHGICAGLRMFHDCNIMRVRNGWNDGLRKLYNYAAWVITCHNMWTASGRDSIILYKKRKLDSLVWQKGTYPIDPDRYPVFFLFCLIDSMEPIKVVHDTSLLEKIDVEISDKGLSLEYNMLCGCRDALTNKVDSLKDWLTRVEGNNNKRYICMYK